MCMLNRRSFLKRSALAVVAGAAMPTILRRGVAAAQNDSQAAASNRKVLIVVQLKGGNDGLNTIVPYTNGIYYDLRSTLAIPQAQVLPMDNEVGFHPNMAAFAPLWDEGHFAVVEGVGYPTPSYSHFVSMAYWETAVPNSINKNTTGWLGRYLEQLDVATLGAVPAMNVGRHLPPEFQSTRVSISTVDSLDAYQFQEDPRYQGISDARFGALHGLYTTPSGDPAMDQLLGGAFQSALDGSIAVKEAHAAYTPAVTYPTSNLAQDMLLLAEAIHFNKDLKVGHVALGGFDTHANQLADQGALLLQFSEAVTTFWDDIVAHGHGDEVVIMTWSEFGRRPKSNASDGTDHGSAGPMFLMGNSVVGGLYGQRPSLTNLDKGNLKFTTDFRSVYSTVLEDWLGVSAKEVLGGSFEKPLLIANSS
jgi:uncharacterized protein (DUF1501 family)